ncbi:hypothetical protein RRG08_030039 [Elysia crispata]|uniref:Uncharacterized protein n=1 Tax=Elysia crispata TaxID=231223 RepID=A0AAE1CPL0_9GAST|nr:hypothetical protein RRG08_030039 [Elysia crispata]
MRSCVLRYQPSLAQRGRELRNNERVTRCYPTARTGLASVVVVGEAHVRQPEEKGFKPKKRLRDSDICEKRFGWPRTNTPAIILRGSPGVGSNLHIEVRLV